MKTIIYAGDELITGDDIAAAVLRLGEALARVREAATIEIPAINRQGRLIAATLLVGPASQIIAEDAPESGEEVVDEQLVAELNDRADALDGTAGHTEDTPPTSWVEGL